MWNEFTCALENTRIPDPVIFSLNDNVVYTSNDQRHQAIVVGVHHDMDPPYYTIKVDGGREVSTEIDKLEKC